MRHLRQLDADASSCIIQPKTKATSPLAAERHQWVRCAWQRSCNGCRPGPQQQSVVRLWAWPTQNWHGH